MELVYANDEFAKEVRRYLHQNPELSLQEHNTSRYLQQHLTRMGIKYDIVGETGIYGYLEGEGYGTGRVLLRADIDALPIEEQASVSFKSQHPGVMHACGHDIHTAALLAALQYLADHKQSFGGRVYFAFQPGEEFGHGAQFFTQAKLNEGYDRVFALHIAPEVSVGTVLVSRQADAASCDYFKISIKGKATHVTTPHLGADALLAVSELAGQLHSIPAEFLSPWEKVSISVGRLQAGEAFNIVADKAELEGSMRAFSNEARQTVKAKIQQLAKGIELKHGVSIEIAFSCFAEPLVNDQQVVKEVTELMQHFTRGVRLQLADKPVMGFAADDFSDFTAYNPGIYLHVGVRDSSYPPSMEGLHSAWLEPDEAAIPLAANLYLNYALYSLEKLASV